MKIFKVIDRNGNHSDSFILANSLNEAWDKLTERFPLEVDLGLKEIEIII